MPLDLKKPVPLYLQIAEDIVGRIESGDLAIGAQLGSQQTLSREYHVSLMTVKKALSHLAHQGWIYSRVGKGSFVARESPVPPPVVLRSIGIVLENLRSAFFSLIVQAVEEAAYRRGYNVLLSNSSGQTEKEERQIRHFREIGVSGLIIASLRHVYHATPTIQMLHREGFPFVMVSYMDDLEIPFVGTDHEEGAFIATQHLIRLGYRRIGYVNAERGNLVGELRKRGFLRALHDAGLDSDGRFLYRIRVHGIRDYYQGGYEIGKRFGESGGQRPDAMFLYNDSAALGFAKAVLESGMRIPNDIALVGFDNIEQGEYAAVPLTTIQQPTDRIGSEAVDVLIRKIEHREAQARTVFLPSLVIRESCGFRSATVHVPNRTTTVNDKQAQLTTEEK
jgi:GntR family transcriptional regulator, arabinose operon transcriptional repressor